jgi:hypothetical protein
MSDAPPPLGSTPPTGSPPSGDSQARTWNMLCHLSALVGLVIPFGSILGPLLVWQIKKNELPSTNEHGKEALNFQISVLIYAIGCAVLALVFIGILLGIVLFLGWLILTIIAGIKANNGEAYRYPATIRLIK